MLDIFLLQHGQQYYTTTSRKVADFFIGAVILSICLFSANLLPGTLFASMAFTIALYLCLAILLFVFVYYGRRWINIGMIVSYLLLALLGVALMGML